MAGSKSISIKPPTLTVGTTKIAYRQVPYVDRYYFIKIGDVYDSYGQHHTIQLSRAAVRYMYALFKEACGNEITPARINQWERFMRRIAQYDDWLDAQPG